MISSKSVPSPSRLSAMISRFNSKTEMPVPSKVTRDGSFWDLNLKKTEEDIAGYDLNNEQEQDADRSKVAKQALLFALS